VITYRNRMAAREMGKVMGFDEDTLKRISAAVATWEFKDENDALDRLCAMLQIEAASRRRLSSASFSSLNSQVATAAEIRFSVSRQIPSPCPFRARHAIAIGNHVGGHGRSARSVALIDVLDHALALVAAGQIEIDVGPFATLLERKRSNSNSMPIGSTAVMPSE